MEIICKDGTVIRCQDFETTDTGVLFFRDEPRREGEDDDEEPRRASGFVPTAQLQFILPDGMVQRGGQQRTGAPEGTPASTPHQATGMAQQQQMGDFPGSSRPSPPQPGPGSGRH